MIVINYNHYRGREFSLNSMNEILLDMSKRLTDAILKTRKLFKIYGEGFL